jgi:GNAT superfamily N-acetyltransferase
MFITARETSSGDLVGSIRYEPRIELEQLDADNNVVATIPLKFDQIFPTPPQDDLNQIYTMIQQQEVFKPFESHLKRSSVYANVISQLEQNNTCKKISLKSIGHFSMFVVDSTKQGRGYGDLLLNHIQNVTLCLGQIVKLLLQIEVSDNYYDVEMKAKMEMVVLSPRQDMIKFYEKRGYSCVGQLPPEPYMLPNVKEEYHDLLELIYERQLEYPAGGVKA